MQMTLWVLPVLCHASVFALCVYLLIRGVTHSFVGLFAAGALLEMLRSLWFGIFWTMPGSFGDQVRFMPIVVFVGTIGMLLNVGGFGALAGFLLRLRSPSKTATA